MGFEFSRELFIDKDDLFCYRRFFNHVFQIAFTSVMLKVFSIFSGKQFSPFPAIRENGIFDEIRKKYIFPISTLEI